MQNIDKKMLTLEGFIDDWCWLTLCVFNRGYKKITKVLKSWFHPKNLTQHQNCKPSFQCLHSRQSCLPLLKGFLCFIALNIMLPHVFLPVFFFFFPVGVIAEISALSLGLLRFCKSAVLYDSMQCKLPLILYNCASPAILIELPNCFSGTKSPHGS